ncbi:hypothetical protein [Nonomuraea sp. NPDC002799]
MPGGSSRSNTRIRLIDVGDADAISAHPYRVLRNLILGLAGRIPAVRNRLAWQLSGLNRRQAS